RDIMKQLIEKKLVEQYENMSIGGRGGGGGKIGNVDDLTQGGEGKAGRGGAGQIPGDGVAEGVGGLPFAINADELDLTGILRGEGMGDLGELIGPGNDAAIRTGFTPRGLMATPGGARGGEGEGGGEGGVSHDRIMQVAVSAAAAAVGAGGEGMGQVGEMQLGEGEGLDEFTSDVIKGL
ncbi:hypothetical protein TrCOL_g7396, partial [Triparma columacea]